MPKSKFTRIFFVFFVVITGVIVYLQMVNLGGKVARAAVTWPDIEVISRVSGLSSPVHLTHAGDGSHRLFVVERAGKIRIIQNHILSATPFLDIQDRVLSNGGEEGLLSVAFSPDYANNGNFYVYYTNLNGDNQVSRFQVASINA